MTSKKWFILALLLFLWIPSVSHADFKIDARAAVLMDPMSGKVLYEQNAHQHLPPASVTKLMTMLLIMEAVESGRVKWTDPIQVTREAAQMGGSGVYLKEGEVFSLRELFETIAVVSANDSSTAVAQYLYGSLEDFINAMNDRAKALGLKDTHFANETGLPDPDHYSSAYDLAVLSRELITKHPLILKFSSIWLDTFRGGKFQLRNTNELIKVYRGADGLKTGHTDEAKFCLSATAKRGGFRLLSVILGADTDEQRVIQSQRLLDYGYRTYEWKLVHSAKEKTVGTLYLQNGQPNHVPVNIKQDFGVVLERGKNPLITTILTADKNLKFPIALGAKVGTLKAVINKTVLGEAAIYSTVKVHRANFIVRGWRWLMDWLRSLFGGKTQ